MAYTINPDYNMTRRPEDYTRRTEVDDGKTAKQNRKALAAQDQSIANAMKKIKKLEHDSQNSFAKYTYVSADGLFEQIRPILAEEGLVVDYHIGETSELKAGERTYMIINIGVRFGRIEDYTIHPIPLARMDAQSIQSAITYAIKYFLRSRLMLSTGEKDMDAEQPATENLNSKRLPQAKPRAQAKPKEIKYTHDDEMLILINGTSIKKGKLTKAEIQKLYLFVMEAITKTEKNDRVATIDMLNNNFDELTMLIPEPGIKAILKKIQEDEYPQSLLDKFAEFIQPEETKKVEEENETETETETE